MRQMTLAMEQNGLSLSSHAWAGKGSVSASDSTSARGSLTEMIMQPDSAIQPLHLLPLLAQCNEQQRWLMWLSPELRMKKHYLDALGLRDSAIIHLGVNAETQLSLCLKALAAANSHLIVEWQGPLSNSQRQQIEQQACISGSHVILISHR